MENLTLQHFTVALGFIFSLTTVVSCGGGNSGDNSSVTSETLLDILVTDRGDDKQQAWVCMDPLGEPLLFTFYDKNTFEGLEQLRLGTEYSLRPDVTPFQYAWRPVDNTTIRIESPPQGLQDEWFDIEFSQQTAPVRLMKATSAARGQLHCSLEGEI